MIVQLHITDAEMKTFFEGMGYTTVMKEVSHFRNVTHGRSEVSTSDKLHIETSEAFIPAESLMNEYVRMSVLRPGSSPEANIDQAARNFFRIQPTTNRPVEVSNER